jgi:hypothetical protein
VALNLYALNSQVCFHRFVRSTIESLILVVAAIPVGVCAQNSMLSVCEVLDHRLQYDGKTVVVFGRISATTEGRWLTADCGGRLRIDGSEWATISR